MRRLFIWMLLFGLPATAVAASPETVDQLKARAETAPPQDRPTIFVRIAELQLRAADKFYDEGDVENGRAAVNEIAEYSEKARDAATATRKHLKNVEISARKMAERLKNIKRKLAFDDQPPVDSAIQRLEDIRTALLKEMFKKEKK